MADFTAFLSTAKFNRFISLGQQKEKKRERKKKSIQLNDVGPQNATHNALNSTN